MGWWRLKLQKPGEGSTLVEGKKAAFRPQTLSLLVQGENR